MRRDRRDFGGPTCSVAAWGVANAERARQAAATKALTASLRDSHRLAELDGEDTDTALIFDQVEALAVGYLGIPPLPMLTAALDTRRHVLRRLESGHHRPSERADLYAAVGRLSGVISYAALDLDEPEQAMQHTDAAWRCAEFAGDTDLKAWVRGTQSLIARFQSKYDLALDLVRDGHQYAQPTRGTAAARLLSGEAQCLANLGDSAEANRVLNRAEELRAHATDDDAFHGLFTFSEAKQNYYVGSALTWLDGGADAMRAAHGAETAIEMWRTNDPSDRSLDDEALAHIYLATARLQLKELDGAVTAIRPILDLPAERQISWIIKRLGRVAELLDQSPYRNSRLATDTRAEIIALDG